jgi:hypothetical protein
MALKPDETIAVIARCEAFVLFPFVLEDSPKQVAGHPDVKRPAAAGHDVDKVTALVPIAIEGGSGAMRRDEEQLQILPLRAAQGQDDNQNGDCGIVTGYRDL